eukprot:tig00020801_g13908.t1
MPGPEKRPLLRVGGDRVAVPVLRSPASSWHFARPCSNPRGCHPGDKCTRCGKHFTRQDNLYKHVRQCRKKAPATSRSEPSSAIAIVSDIPRSCQMEGLDLAMSCSARPLLQHLLPARRPARCFSFVDSRLRAGPGATCRSARFPARRPVGCFSFVDSRLRAGSGATCRSARFPARRPAGCFSFVCSRQRAGPGAARPPAFPPAAALACPPPGAAARVATHLPASPGRPPCLSSCPSAPSPAPPPPPTLANLVGAIEPGELLYSDCVEALSSSVFALSEVNLVTEEEFRAKEDGAKAFFCKRTCFAFGQLQDEQRVRKLYDCEFDEWLRFSATLRRKPMLPPGVKLARRIAGEIRQIFQTEDEDGPVIPSGFRLLEIPGEFEEEILDFAARTGIQCKTMDVELFSSPLSPETCPQECLEIGAEQIQGAKRLLGDFEEIRLCHGSVVKFLLPGIY